MEDSGWKNCLPSGLGSVLSTPGLREYLIVYICSFHVSTDTHLRRDSEIKEAGSGSLPPALLCCMILQDFLPHSRPLFNN